MKLQVITPSRLHFGLLDLNGSLGRLYGGIGVALEKPGFILEITEEDSLSIIGKYSSLVRPLVKKFSQYYHLNPKVEINIRKIIPLHQGLGSETQLALAVASGLAKVYGIKATLGELSLIMGRGRISAIGTAAFEKGGFIVDGGQRINSDKEIPPIIFHTSFPQGWRFVVAIPSGKGLHSAREKEAFKKIIPTAPRLAGEICRLLQMKLLPALKQKDLHSFGQALTEIDKKGGRYFKEVQGGVYTKKITGKLINFMLAAGAKGAGQSSWGPAVYALVSAANVTKLEKATRDFFKERSIEGLVYQSAANNSGAEISLI